MRVNIAINTTNVHLTIIFGGKRRIRISKKCLDIIYGISLSWPLIMGADNNRDPCGLERSLTFASFLEMYCKIKAAEKTAPNNVHR